MTQESSNACGELQGVSLTDSISMELTIWPSWGFIACKLKELTELRTNGKPTDRAATPARTYSRH
eukprot:CAMPEP_0183405022 /NCGR_PEP_ID=MMETSP0370-20130417/15510_1 /TAXON_ID=268820 /ORGANISM="Peridinium aciculiferum, Strain PAER-2" /LENGTH=64 /DNA_ID=CAMNT_0025586929 /DNA_START=338 /DNA_END=532 /DNA_ORIENTATION=-